MKYQVTPRVANDPTVLMDKLNNFDIKPPEQNRA